MPTVWSCRCGRQWTGTSSAHCSVCHEHFSTVKNFDLHGVNRRGCPDPATLTRTRRDGTVVPLLKPVQEVRGVTWVGYSEDERYADQGEEASA